MSEEKPIRYYLYGHGDDTTFSLEPRSDGTLLAEAATMMDLTVQFVTNQAGTAHFEERLRFLCHMQYAAGAFAWEYKTLRGDQGKWLSKDEIEKRVSPLLAEAAMILYKRRCGL